MKVALCTLCLNEEQFLMASYNQHKDWPDLCCWVFIEAADPIYAEANPDLVTRDGLSTDDTTHILDALYVRDKRVAINHYGWMRDANSSQNKTRGRDRYLDVLEEVKPDLFIVIDVDEFYTKRSQMQINKLVKDKQHTAWILRQRHLWQPPSLSHREFPDLEVVGGYWNVPHVRVFRWRPGMRYREDHNWPLYPDRSHNPDERFIPECIHLGFARLPSERAATNRYYQQRGEGATDGRQMYVDCRAAWENWKLGDSLPHGAYIRKYRGEIPEVYQPK